MLETAETDTYLKTIQKGVAENINIGSCCPEKSNERAYLQTAENIYKDAAENPDVGLCCTTTPIWSLPGLIIPKKMLEMNYGCGSTVHPRDLVNKPTILYVGVGGGMELLQFCYFNQREGGIIGVDAVDEMLLACKENFVEAEKVNSWFESNFVDLRHGDALKLPIGDNTIDVAAQNCLFNIFKEEELREALQEMHRVLKPHGRLVLSDPVSESPISDDLKNDATLRGLCLSGALPLKQYIDLITEVGFGTVEIRAKRPYRVLASPHYDTKHNIYIESVEVCAIKEDIPDDGPCVFTGRSAIYFGKQESYDDNAGHILMNNQPLSICDKTADNLQQRDNSDILITESTFFYDGGGSC